MLGRKYETVNQSWARKEVNIARRMATRVIDFVRTLQACSGAGLNRQHFLLVPELGC